MSYIIRRATEIKDELFDTPGGKFISFWLILVSLSDCLFWTIWLQIHGTIPSVDHLNLWFWHPHLSFGISRLWDVFLAPIFLVFDGFIMSSELFSDEDMHGNEETTGFGTFLIISALIGLVCGLVFGLPYALFVSLESFIFFFVCFIIFAVIMLVKDIRKELAFNKEQKAKFS